MKGIGRHLEKDRRGWRIKTQIRVNGRPHSLWSEVFRPSVRTDAVRTLLSAPSVVSVTIRYETGTHSTEVTYFPPAEEMSEEEMLAEDLGDTETGKKRTGEEG